MPTERPDHSPITENVLGNATVDTAAGPISPHQLPVIQPVLTTRYLKQGWQLLWARPGLYIGYAAIVVLALFVLQRLWAIGQLLSIIAMGPLLAGFYYALRRQLQGLSFGFEEFFNGFNHFLPLMLVSLVTSILISIGMMLLLLPGIYLAVSYLFALPLVQDRELEFWAAMETSRRLITRQWFSFLGLALLLAIINAIGLFLVGLGLLITLPLTIATIAAAYDHQVGFKRAA